ncbi:recombination and DNA strand exchange inhibitor protein [Helicobacter didelphidarum]|uniref:Recombination and DNA strand exchange inhibitor protein n=1 Tax=Helicobacter didelphidarum TaxID=2040648 RepID=A0A3D8IFD6_9HELI|nr:Smr/MutS family protein [Helicobacter didelphidarum]RDU63606.1 recombination and DNA strand exchange inhibitor protein [Helicobacter didelphidarum]
MSKKDQRELKHYIKTTQTQNTEDYTQKDLKHLSQSRFLSYNQDVQGYNQATYQNLIAKLGLQDFIRIFASYFSRKMWDIIPTNRDFLKDSENKLSPGIRNNQNNCDNAILEHILHISSLQKMYELLLALESHILPKLPCISFLDDELLRLNKGATLRLQEIFEFMQIVNFFYDFKNRDDITEGYLYEYCQKFIFPHEILDLLNLFDFNLKESLQQGNNSYTYLKFGADSQLDSYLQALDSKFREKQTELYSAMNLIHLQEYLVDKQLHFIENNLALLVRAGYSHAIKAKVISRSAHGFFYIVPLSLENIQSQIYTLQDKIQARTFELEKEYSKILQKYVPFLRFINKEYDFIDRVLARLHFAKDYNFEFVFSFLESKSIKDSIILHEYAHPSLKKPIPIKLEIIKNLVMITGVNAGGKTMLLKSILSALFCAKVLLPMKINAAKSYLPFIKNIAIIAQDPQDSKNDISTFSGRISEFKQFLNTKDLILGIDEIEIGTDASEAASLYKVLLDNLLKNSVKILVTTHHKHLVTLMADNPQTQLLAALYDYKKAQPTFEFIDGVGKSYALECALHYGIPQHLIDEARKVHGEEANKLERLIEQSHYQIIINKQNEIKLQNLVQQQEAKNKELEALQQTLRNEFEKQSLQLKRHYNEAIKEIKMLAKQSQKNLITFSEAKNLESTQQTIAAIHRLLNKTHKNQENILHITPQKQQDFNVGERVKYHKKFARILEKKDNIYTLQYEDNNMKIKGIKGYELTQTNEVRQIQSTHTLKTENKASLSLDLHGLTKEQACEELESFISQAIIAKFQEVLIVHGRGSGILQQMVVQYLQNSKVVRGFVDAPYHLGGKSAKLVYLD